MIDYGDPDALIEEIKKHKASIEQSRQQILILEGALKALRAGYKSDGVIKKQLKVTLDGIFGKYQRLMTVEEIFNNVYHLKNERTLSNLLRDNKVRLKILTFKEEGYKLLYGPIDFFNEYGVPLRQYFPDKETRDKQRKGYVERRDQ